MAAAPPRLPPLPSRASSTHAVTLHYLVPASAVLVLSRQNPELEAIIVEAANSLDISLADLQAFARLTFGELFAEALVAPQPQPLSAPPTSAPATPLTKYMNPAYNGNAAGDSAASNGIVAVHAMCNQVRATKERASPRPGLQCACRGFARRLVLSAINRRGVALAFTLGPVSPILPARRKGTNRLRRSSSRYVAARREARWP